MAESDSDLRVKLPGIPGPGLSLFDTDSIQSQNPIENVASKVPDLESKQRFSEDSEWSTLGALKMPPKLQSFALFYFLNSLQ